MPRCGACRPSERALEQRGAVLVAELSQVESTITTTYEAVRPKRDTSDPAAILLSRERWDAAHALLESGRDLPTVVETADVPTVLAIEAFAPDYLWAQATRELGAKAEGDHAAAIRRDVETLTRKRLTVIAAEADQAVLTAAYRAQGFLDVAWVWAGHLLKRFQGIATEALTAALEVNQIWQTYGIDQTVQQRREAVNNVVSAAESARFRLAQQWTARTRSA